MPEISFGNLYDFIINEPYQAGYRKLSVVSGFASSAVVRQVLLEHPHVKLKLIIGMARGSGIPDADHKTYSDLVKRYPERAECLYYVGRPLVHAKFYVWSGGAERPFGIVTSANFSWSGFGRYYEAGVQTDSAPLETSFKQLRENSISVLSPKVNQYVRIIEVSSRNTEEVSIAHGSLLVEPGAVMGRVSLSLLSADGNVPARSGLNWGQRPGRNPNQAYISVPASVHQEHPGLFPARGQRFIVKTDDGQTLVCVIAQDNSKAIETPDDNSALGLYFRKRLGVADGEFVALADVTRYGRTDVEFTKVDNDLFLLNFSKSES